MSLSIARRLESMSLSTPTVTAINYSDATITRAQRALCCSPFRVTLFAAMLEQSVSLLSIPGAGGLEKGYTSRLLTEAAVESYLLWLIKVGILRREVDGQGITDSFRLTPLGRKLIEKWQPQGDFFPQPTFWQRFLNTLQRWFSF
ncbi:MAG: hypothetical protein DWQ56_13130 [Microcystis aeruginosa DA14]|uniref:Uncharacterized protein n=3 Tax=Microcystaceae TaxID=1890449 RepID=A0A3E0MA09_MICAE|nr:MAG: hypothetical protein DWQ56_13130 [Microcystis aeruginosa DA14]